VQPHRASSNLPSGTRAERSVLPGRVKAASTAGRRRKRQEEGQEEGKRGEAKEAKEWETGLLRQQSRRLMS
jgi:hypothetical protein